MTVAPISSKRVILLNRFFFPDQSPTSELLSDLAFALGRVGCRVMVITSRLRYDDRTAKLSSREVARSVEIRRVWSFRSKADTLIGRALEYLSFYLSAGSCLWQSAGRGDIIIAKTDPPLLSIMAAPIARLKGARLINWLQDLFPEVAVELGVAGAIGRPAFHLLRRLRNRSLRSASVNVVPGSGMAKTLEQEGIAPQHISVIANWSDGKLIQPIPSEGNELRRRWGLAHNVIVAYAGNFGRAHDFDTIIEAMTQHQQHATLAPAGDIMHQIAFLFVGGGAQHKALEREITVRKLVNAQVHPYQPRELLATLLGAADIHLVSLRPELEGLVVPSKIYGIIAAARPVIFIGSPIGEVARLIEHAKCGFTVEPEDSKTLLDRIIKLAKNHSLMKAMGTKARLAFEHQWDKPHAMAKWLSLLDVTSKREVPD